MFSLDSKCSPNGMKAFDCLNLLEIKCKLFDINILNDLAPSLAHLRISASEFVENNQKIDEIFIFKNPTRLETLRIEDQSTNNDLLEQPMCLNQLEHLQKLELYSYKLTDTNLNLLRSLPSSIKHLDLQFLDATPARLDNLFELNDFELVNLTHFSMKLNNRDDDKFGNDFSESINGKWFAGFPNLASLNLSGNHICQIDSSCFSHLKTLEMLDLSFNKLKSLEAKDLKGLDNLTGLNLSFCQIKHVDSNAFNSTPSLSEIYLQSNKISNLSSKTFYKLKHLRVLNLEKNRLRTLPKNLLRMSRNLREMLIGGFYFNGFDPRLLNGLKLDSLVLSMAMCDQTKVEMLVKNLENVVMRVRLRIMCDPEFSKERVKEFLIDNDLRINVFLE